MNLLKTKITCLSSYKYIFNRIVEYNNQYYLMCVDGPLRLILWFLPFLEWIVPHKLYLIDDKTANELQLRGNINNLSFSSILGTGILVTIFGKPLSIWLQQFSLSISPKILSISPIIMVTLELLFILGCRYFLSKLSWNLIKKQINKKASYSIWLIPAIKNKSYVIFPAMLFVGFLLSGCIYIQLYDPNDVLIGILGTIVMGSMYLLASNAAIHSGDFYIYKLKNLID